MAKSFNLVFTKLKTIGNSPIQISTDKGQTWSDLISVENALTSKFNISSDTNTSDIQVKVVNSGKIQNFSNGIDYVCRIKVDDTERSEDLTWTNIDEYLSPISFDYEGGEPLNLQDVYSVYMAGTNIDNLKLLAKLMQNTNDHLGTPALYSLFTVNNPVPSDHSDQSWRSDADNNLYQIYYYPNKTDWNNSDYNPYDDYVPEGSLHCKFYVTPFSYAFDGSTNYGSPSLDNVENMADDASIYDWSRDISLDWCNSYRDWQPDYKLKHVDSDNMYEVYGAGFELNVNELDTYEVKPGRYQLTFMFKPKNDTSKFPYDIFTRYSNIIMVISEGQIY